MALIRSRDTTPERVLARVLRTARVRFRRHVRRLPGTPDFVLPQHRLAVFVHGCFWHGHVACGKASLPVQNREFWREKIARNRRRDRRTASALRARGWRTLTLWECRLTADGLPPRLSAALAAKPRRRGA